MCVTYSNISKYITQKKIYFYFDALLDYDIINRSIKQIDICRYNITFPLVENIFLVTPSL